MTDLRTAAQQAIGLICRARLCEINSMSSRQEMLRLLIEAIDTLRAALAQQAEPAEPAAKVELMMTGGNAGLATRIVEIDDHLRERLRPGQLLYTTPPQQAEPFTPDAIRTTQTAWKMGYDAAKAETQQAEPWERRVALAEQLQMQQAEPAQEPVGTVRVDAGEVHIVPLVRDAGRSPLKDGQAVYAAPPPRKPLTDEEILEAVGWERAEMYMKLTPNFPVEEARKETLKNARAVEVKHNIKERP